MEKKLKKLPKGAQIVVLGRRWFDKNMGNTYHSVDVFVNCQLIDRAPFNYGYDNAYQQTAMDLLEKSYILPFTEEERLFYRNFRRLHEHGYKVLVACCDVQNKKDL